MISDPPGSDPVGAAAAPDNSNCASFYIEESTLGGFSILLLETDDALAFNATAEGMCQFIHLICLLVTQDEALLYVTHSLYNSLDTTCLQN